MIASRSRVGAPIFVHTTSIIDGVCVRRGAQMPPNIRHIIPPATAGTEFEV